MSDGPGSFDLGVRRPMPPLTMDAGVFLPIRGAPYVTQHKVKEKGQP